MFLQKFVAFFSFFAEKTLKITISASVWGAQHPNAGQNIQQMVLFLGIRVRVYRHYKVEGGGLKTPEIVFRNLWMALF